MTRSKPFLTHCFASSYPMPVDAPVTTASGRTDLLMLIACKRRALLGNDAATERFGKRRAEADRFFWNVESEGGSAVGLTIALLKEPFGGLVAHLLQTAVAA